MKCKARFIFAVCVLLACLSITAQSQELADRPTGPKLIRCTPAVITSGMSIKLDGYRIGDYQSRKVKVRFVQGDNTYTGSAAGGQYGNDFELSLENVRVVVPKGLTPGKCQIIIEADGLVTAPLEVEVAASVSPAEISNPMPPVAPPGEEIWIYALGIGESDEVELVDSAGEIHHIDANPTSEGIRVTFTLPDDLPDGEATFYVVDKRSGLNHHSNSLSLRVEVAPAPLVIYVPVNSQPLAPGQWVDATVLNPVAAHRAERIEVAFLQNEQVIVPLKSFKGTINSRLHVRVPTSFVPGQVKITTRTWIKGRPSSWSEPLELELLDHPAAPYLWGICIGTPRGNEQSISFEYPRGIMVITARGGDMLQLSGLFLVESAAKLRITLEGPGQRFELPAIAADDQAEVDFKIPRKPRPGEWQMIVTNLDKGVSSKVPITLVITR